MTISHNPADLPVLCASLPGQIEPHHLRIVLTSLPTLSTLPPRVALAVNLAGQFYKNVRWQQMGASTNERARTRCVEVGMEAQTILYRRQVEDVAEHQDLARLDGLADRLKEVTARRIERDNEENRDHELLAQIAREFTSLVDQLQLRQSERQSAA